MQSVRKTRTLSLAVAAILVVGVSTGAFASCGDSMSVMAQAAATLPRSAAVMSTTENSAAPNDIPVNNSIVGLWHVRFLVGDQTIQEAFQIWNTGGTEVHNPNGDPRGGTMCLGTWKQSASQTFKLAHRVWKHDTNGNYLGTIHLSETITLGDGGSTQSGTFTLAFYDPAGNFMFSVPGTVVGERITVE